MGAYSRQLSGTVSFYNFTNNIASIADANEDFLYTCAEVLLGSNEYNTPNF